VKLGNSEIVIGDGESTLYGGLLGARRNQPRPTPALPRWLGVARAFLHRGREGEGLTLGRASGTEINYGYASTRPRLSLHSRPARGMQQVARSPSRWVLPFASLPPEFPRPFSGPQEQRLKGPQRDFYHTSPRFRPPLMTARTLS